MPSARRSGGVFLLRYSGGLVNLTGLIHNLDIVSVRIEHPGRVVVRMILELSRRRSLLAATGCDCRIKKRVYHCLTFSLKPHMNGGRIRHPLLKPKEVAPVCSKPLQVRVTILTVKNHKVCKAERLESFLVERNRALKIAYGQNDVVKHGLQRVRGWGERPVPQNKRRLEDAVPEKPEKIGSRDPAEAKV